MCFSLNFGSTSFRNFPIDAFGFLFVCVWSVSVHLYLYLPRVFLYTVLIGVFHSDKLRDLLFTRRRSSPFSSGSASTGFTFTQPSREFFAPRTLHVLVTSSQADAPRTADGGLPPRVTPMLAASTRPGERLMSSDIFHKNPGTTRWCFPPV